MQTIKIHQPIIDTVVACVKAIFEEEKVADKEVQYALKQNKRFGARDRSMIAESVYDIVRWKIKYMHQLEIFDKEFNQYSHLVLVSLLNRKYEILNPAIFNINNTQLQDLITTIQLPIAQNYIASSYPEAFYSFCENTIGENWHSLANALNEKPAVFIRANTLKTTAIQLSSFLQDANIEHSILHDDAIQILSKNNLKNSDLYQQGLFEFQDIGSQAIGQFLYAAIENKSKLNNCTILDLCAGAGGKTLHLSALLKNKGTIYATDFKAVRLKNLQQRAQQAGCTNIEIIDFKEAKQLKNIDYILIDAPCSGTGTFKRQADLKYKVSLEKIEMYQSIQQDLLNSYTSVLAKDGKIVYATCSILPLENALQLNHFIKNNSSFTLEKEQQLLPTEYNGDGFYMACVKYRC